MIALLGWGALALNLIAYFITQPRKALIALAGSEIAWIVFALGVASWLNGLCAVFGILILSYKIKTQTLSSPAV